jgi:hypothetical protein
VPEEQDPKKKERHINNIEWKSEFKRKRNPTPKREKEKKREESENVI